MLDGMSNALDPAIGRPPVATDTLDPVDDKIGLLTSQRRFWGSSPCPGAHSPLQVAWG